MSPEPASTKWWEVNGWNINLGWIIPLYSLAKSTGWKECTKGVRLVSHHSPYRGDFLLSVPESGDILPVATSGYSVSLPLSEQSLTAAAYLFRGPKMYTGSLQSGNKYCAATPSSCVDMIERQWVAGLCGQRQCALILQAYAIICTLELRTVILPLIASVFYHDALLSLTRSTGSCQRGFLSANHWVWQRKHSPASLI